MLPFWQTNNFFSYLLGPFSVVYSAVAWLREHLVTPKSITKPVICVGNVVVGGSGKTPVALALSQLLRDQLHCSSGFISRGYKSDVSLKEPILVRAQAHKSTEVGDEPLLLARIAPTVVCVDRYKAARHLLKQGVDCIIMDDGLQHPYLQKSLALLVIDQHYGIGNGKTLPAGPLRESFHRALKKSDALIIVGEQVPENIAKKLPDKFPVVFATRDPLNGTKFEGKRVVAFSGIAQPEKFFDTLRSVGAECVETFAFPDHHQYSDSELLKLSTAASHHDAQLVTTDKDFVRLSQVYQAQIQTLQIGLAFKNPEILVRLLKPLLN